MLTNYKKTYDWSKSRKTYLTKFISCLDKKTTCDVGDYQGHPQSNKGHPEKIYTIVILINGELISPQDQEQSKNNLLSLKIIARTIRQVN